MGEVGFLFCAGGEFIVQGKRWSLADRVLNGL